MEIKLKRLKKNGEAFHDMDWKAHTVKISIIPKSAAGIFIGKWQANYKIIKKVQGSRIAK